MCTFARKQLRSLLLSFHRHEHLHISQLELAVLMLLQQVKLVRRDPIDLDRVVSRSKERAHITHEAARDTDINSRRAQKCRACDTA